MQYDDEPLQIKEVSPADAPMELLLQADPSVEKIKGYLGQSRCLVAVVGKEAVGSYVVKEIASGTYELMSISVVETFQGRGIGTMLLKHAISFVHDTGARRLEVGTGTFGYQLAYYQRQGFRVTAIDRDFFLKHYPEPLYESGIQHKDMLRLTLEYPC